MTGLENLSFIDGNIEIDYNYFLGDLTGLGNGLILGVNFVSLSYNRHLTMCNSATICNLLENTPFFVYKNDVGCNTATQMINACVPSCASLPPVISINDQPISDGIYRAADEVNSVGIVPNGGYVDFKAAQTILLDNNFTVEPNADFSAKIRGCTGQ